MRWRVSEVIRRMADGISKAGDSIAHLIRLGTMGYDALSERRTRARLIDLLAVLIQLNADTVSWLVGAPGFVRLPPMSQPLGLRSIWISNQPCLAVRHGRIPQRVLRCSACHF